jgi:hypothetical protein
VFFYGPVPDPAVVYQANHPDGYAMEMPQSGERIVGRENMRRFHKAYPGGPSIRLRRALVRDGLWVVEGVNDYVGGHRTDFAMILELKDGRIWETGATTRSLSRLPCGGLSGSSGRSSKAHAHPNFSRDAAAC